jgi:predicted HicB family RNase H-like nuclease
MTKQCDIEYPVLIEPDKGGYVVSYLDFPDIVMGYGHDITEAIEEAEKARIAYFEKRTTNGLDVPNPGEFFKSCNGTITLRVPREVHKRLKVEAFRNNESLNKYAASLITRGGES